jgi:leucyl aminopeptidase
LINAPANDLGPAELEAAAEALAKAHGGTFSSIVGDALLSSPGGGYPLIHAVGRAATPERAPRLLDLRWGRADAPRVTLVGKGVCFDTGGLDIKPASNMVNMKKDVRARVTDLAACVHADASAISILPPQMGGAGATRIAVHRLCTPEARDALRCCSL